MLKFLRIDQCPVPGWHISIHCRQYGEWISGAKHVRRKRQY